MSGFDLFARLHESLPTDRWATPSVIPDLEPFDPALDQSISNRRLGSPLEHNGAFASLEVAIAEARGAVHAWPLTNGSTSGNQIAMFGLARQFRAPKVLAAVNCHHSVINAASAFGVAFRYMRGHMLSGYEALLPPTAPDVAAALDEDPSVNIVWLSSPTYEGLVADVPAIAEVVHARDGMLVVDAAWGAHFGYHPDLPAPTATLGADLVIESTHKTGGGLQGSAVLLASGWWVDIEAIELAFKALSSTSPSFLLLAAMGVALERLRMNGKSYLDVALEHAAALRDGLLARGVPVLHHANLVDLTKVTFAGLAGFAVESHLDKRGIVIEKATPRSALLLATMQLRSGAAGRALAAIDELLDEEHALSLPADGESAVRCLRSAPAVEPHEAIRAATDTVPLADAVGRVAGELVELYPPGIPVLAPGWRITADAVVHLLDAQAAGAHVVPSRLDAVRVLRHS